MRNNPLIQPPSWIERWVIRILILAGVLSIGHFLYWFLQPEFRGHPVLFGMLCVVFGYGMLRHLYLWYHYAAIQVPEKPGEVPDLSVDVLTTHVPGEPIEMIEETLRAVQKISYPHTTYLCDEGDDPYLKKLCSEIGVRHVTRKTRKDAKAGNINNALQQASGDVCLILDPDHVPQSNILDHIIPHFTDPEVGFVQIVQSYYNQGNSLVAKGAAEQTYQFYGPMMMSMNSYGTVNAIGANCTFRRKALDSIGGHAPGLAEDMHTAMQLYARGWKSVYVPQVLARGLVPETLLTHFKQQLKWSRGTFELLFRVYPGLFKYFSWRQKLHFGLLPLHFLVGCIYLLSFFIPVVSLLFSVSPWTGNILIFLMAVLPVALSTLLIRAFIQKWVIERSERGFHLVGGLLQIATWWIHFQGLVYAVINKDVPYLPTEKKETQVTNLRIVIPNLLIGLISVFAVIYGLYRDLTPFSMVMAGFAAVNAGFMFFSLYLATGLTNENRILRDRFPNFTQSIGKPLKHAYRSVSRFVFTWTRRTALPVLLLGVLLTLFTLDRYLHNQWEGIIPKVPPVRKGPDYSGIFLPGGPNGLTDMDAVASLEERLDHRFDLISLYVAWGDGVANQLPGEHIWEIYTAGSLPMITWEPWMNDFKASDTITALKENHKVFQHILSGRFDHYINDFASQLASLQRPVFLRFAHEFDNPAYPWSETGGNLPDEFKQAWRYIHKRFMAQSAFNVIWLWNPYTHENARTYFPGESYVDWIGVTALNYGSLNQDGIWRSFNELYKYFDKAFESLPDLPVMLAEFGSLHQGGDREQWLADALQRAENDYRKIKAWVFFHSKWDRNIPAESDYSREYLDWTGTLESIHALSNLDREGHSPSGDKTKVPTVEPYAPLKMPEDPIRGVGYHKGQRWYSSHYILDRPTLEKDFENMKAAGINTIRIEDPGVYLHNLLHVSREKDLRLIYSFRIPDSIDFSGDRLALSRLRESILKQVERNKHHSQIVAWNLGNPVWAALRKRYARPALDSQRLAYLTWFDSLCREIKERDPRRLLLADLKPTRGAEEYLSLISKKAIPVDAHGLLLNDTTDLDYFQKMNQCQDVPFYIAQTRVKDLGYVTGTSVVIDSWQDQWEANKVTFDGLVNHQGKKKRSYYDLASQWAGKPEKDVSGSISILRPAIPLYAGSEVTYYAKRYEGDRWRDPGTDQGADYEWFLIKCGYFGEPIALKPLGRGSSLTLEVPRGYPFYRLMLIYQESGTDTPAISVRKTLNLPLYSSD